MRYGVICFLVVCFCYIIVAPGASATRRQERLAGGNAIADHRYPWVVSIQSLYAKDSAPDEIIPERCTGSIIDIYGTVITIAHCVDDPKVDSSGTYRLQNVVVKWGSYFSENNTRIITLPPYMVVRHPFSYSEHRRVNWTDIDVALIFLNRYVPDFINCSDPTVMPIELSTRAENSTPTNGMVAGFGWQPKTNQNKVITGYFRGQLSELKFRYGGRGKRTRYGTQPYDDHIHISSIFFGYPNVTWRDIPYDQTTGMYYTGGCLGDSGGPYMENEDGKIRLRGIAVGGGLLNHTFPCRQASAKPNEFLDINYPLIRNWTNTVLADRYNQTNAGLHGGIPRVCT